MSRRMSRRGRCFALLFALSAATMLSGCSRTSSTLTAGNDLTTASTTPVSFEAVAELGRKWNADQKDVNRGIAYASALESIGQTRQEFTVYDTLMRMNPGNAKVAGLYGRKLVAAGQTEQAIAILEPIATGRQTDWRVLSALGTAYDQQGQFQKARAEYQKGLASDPKNLVLLNNLGMSYALEGNLKQAEATLREADALPGSKAEPRIRQNLALVVGLQGHFEEASSLANADLPPDQVAANMAYLKKMLSQPNTWQQISEGGKG